MFIIEKHLMAHCHSRPIRIQYSREHS